MKTTMPKRKRIVILFLFGIVLPSLLLGYLAFRGVQNDRALLEKNRVDEHLRIAGQVSQAVDENIQAAELAFHKFLTEHNPDNLSNSIQQLGDLKTAHPLIKEVFAIQSDRSIRFIGASLLYQSGDAIELVEDSLLRQSVLPLLQQGEQLEFQKRDYRGALGIYRQALRTKSDAHIQAELLSKIARVEKKMRSYHEAIKTYQTIADKYSHIRIMQGIPLGLVSRMEIGSLHTEMGNQTEAQEAYVDLYRDLLNSLWTLEKESFHFFSDRLKESISGIFELEPSSEHLQSLRNIFQEMTEEESVKTEETERLLLFQQNVLAKRELMDLQSREGPAERKKRLSIEIGTNGYLVCLSGNSPSDEETWGFLADRELLIESLLPGIMQDVIFPEDIDWIIREREGKIVLASTEMPSGSLTVKSEFVGNFPEWTLELYKADPRLLDAFLTSRRGVYFYMFVLIAGILVFGLMLTIRSLTREMELSRMKSDFVSTVSHEFKSPLTSIRQIAEMLHAGRVPSEERRQKYYDVLLEQSERLSLLTENVLSFAKMEEGKRQFVFERVDLDTLIHRLVSSVQDRVGHEGFAVETEIEKLLPPVLADASAVTQAVNNLIDNAVKYSGDSKKVIVKAYSEEQNVVVQVIDFGLGIKKEDMDKIFDRFYRGGDELTRTVKGSGLGLTLVKQIAEAHKGTILVESELGKGSVFTMRFPRDPNKG